MGCLYSNLMGSLKFAGMYANLDYSSWTTIGAHEGRVDLRRGGYNDLYLHMGTLTMQTYLWHFC